MKAEYSKRFASAALFLISTMLCYSTPTYAQAPGSAYGKAVSNTLLPLGRNTPRPVLDGSAQLAHPHDGSQMIRLAIGLKRPNAAAEEEFLAQLSDKKSPQFHHFLTQQEWNARFAPSVQDEEAVVKWAQSQGMTVTQRYPSRLIVDVAAPAATIEAAFSVKINDYALNSSTFFSNDREPVFASSIVNVVDSVLGMNSLQVVQPKIRNFQGPIGGNGYSAGAVMATGGSDQKDGSREKLAVALAAKKAGVNPNITNGYYDPTDLYSSTAYDWNALDAQGHCCNPNNVSGGTPKETSLAIATFSGYDSSNGLYKGGFAGSDITGFQAQYPYLAYHYVYYNIDGYPGECCDIETTLDMEWSISTANSFGSYQATAYILPYIGANNYLSTFADVYSAIQSNNNSRVVSTSWGCAEDCWGGANGVTTLHGIFNSMVGQGWTLVAASGDGGATSDCNTLSVDYPASDPDVVGVGGTTLYTGPGGFSSETGWTGGTFSGACSVNDGGSTGGCSAIFAAPGYQSSPYCGSGSRSVPDISLNASIGENIYYGGSLFGEGGTSIAAPEIAGFMTQENAYLVFLENTIGTSSCFGSGTGSCAPMGQANNYLYYFGYNPGYAPHYPFYDVTSGCNSNDVTAAHGTGYYCAGTGYDGVTGWGSANMLQLAWAINTYIAGDFGAPSITFSGPTRGHWYNSDQTVSWTMVDTESDGHPANGVSGFSYSWDNTISDPFSEATPQRSGVYNSFYSGPQYPNGTSGSTDVASVGQGCHTVYVYAWDNSGFGSGNQGYGSVCYDITPPVTTPHLAGTFAGGQYDGAVQVTLTATDAYSGVAATYLKVDSGSYALYQGAVNVSGVGTHTISYYTVDVAGNAESAGTTTFTIRTDYATALQFIPVTPCRVADTRNATGPFGGPIMSATTTRSFTIPSSACSIPATAKAYSLNVTVVPSGPLGYLTMWPTGQPQPTSSTLNSDGRVKANAAIVPAGTGGAVSVYVKNTTQVILDIDGYFVEAGSVSTGLVFYPLTPCRIADTRNANGSLGGPYLSGGATRAFPILSSSCGIPSSAKAYSLNYTALPKQAPLTYLTTWPTGQSQPAVSTLNAPTGTIVANAAIVPAGTSGEVSVYVSNNTNLLIDVNGYFAAPGGTGGLSLYTLAPCRVLDTRSSSGAFSGTLSVNVEGSSCMVPSVARGYVLNATVVPSASLQYLTIWQNGVAQPGASTLNAVDSATTSNMSLVPTANGMIDAYASGKTQLILDISGYFAP
jgi:hypothetical protein